jgi:hypothetical protein
MTLQDQDPQSDPIAMDNRLQPDPELQLSGGRATPLQIASTILACLVVIAVVIYGLNSQRPEGGESSATTAASASSPAASNTPAPGANPPAAQGQANQQQAQPNQQPGQGQNSQSQNARPPSNASVGQPAPATTGSGGSGPAPAGGSDNPASSNPKK